MSIHPIRIHYSFLSMLSVSITMLTNYIHQYGLLLLSFLGYNTPFQHTYTRQSYSNENLSTNISIQRGWSNSQQLFLSLRFIPISWIVLSQCILNFNLKVNCAGKNLLQDLQHLYQRSTKWVIQFTYHLRLFSYIEWICDT